MIADKIDEMAVLNELIDTYEVKRDGSIAVQKDLMNTVIYNKKRAVMNNNNSLLVLNVVNQIENIVVDYDENSYWPVSHYPNKEELTVLVDSLCQLFSKDGGMKEVPLCKG